MIAALTFAHSPVRPNALAFIYGGTARRDITKRKRNLIINGKDLNRKQSSFDESSYTNK